LHLNITVTGLNLKEYRKISFESELKWGKDVAMEDSKLQSAIL
jgi:hypothetical protein